MKKFSIIFSIVLMLAIAVPAGAYTINTLFATPGDDPNGYTSPYAGVQVENFNTGYGNLLWTWSGNGWIVSLPNTYQYAAPMGQNNVADQTPYVSVPKGYGQEDGSPIVEVTAFGTANYLGLWWGSMDLYNTFTFYMGTTEVESFTGKDVITQGAAYGDQVALGSNHYVNFRDLPNFDRVTFSSSEYAFEADNLAIGAVPEPTTMLLLGFGLIGLAGLRRKS
jgi:hypothetical protein